jgi:hypothetical protein
MLALAGCGYIGEPQYPALNIPTAVGDLSAVQRGDHLLVVFSIPPLTTEGVVLRTIGEIELRIGPNHTNPFSVNEWAASAQRETVPPPAKPGLVETNVPIQSFVGQDVVVMVRVANAKGRYSQWSNPQTVSIGTPLVKAADLTPTAVAEGVRLQWKAPGDSHFRIYRRTEKELTPSQLGTSDSQEYVDKTTEYKKRYEYYVQAFDGANESEITGPVEITPEDIFPPVVPTGLTATAGINAIELAWERNSEKDFKEYRVYRAVEDGPFAKVAEGLTGPNYSDHQVESGKHYKYAVSAVDELGHESERSAPITATAP